MVNKSIAAGRVAALHPSTRADSAALVEDQPASCSQAVSQYRSPRLRGGERHRQVAEVGGVELHVPALAGACCRDISHVPGHRVFGELEQVEGPADEEERVPTLFGPNPPAMFKGDKRGKTHERESRRGRRQQLRFVVTL